MRALSFLFSLVMIATGLFACAAPAAENNAPSTTAAPTEATSKYPEPDKLIALTFDDGPNVHMKNMVEILDAYDAKGSFFLIGKKIADNQSTVAMAYEKGHEIGNHSFSHERMPDKTEEEILLEISKVQEAVEAITGEAPVWYRPPFLAASDLTFDLIDMPYAHCGASAGDGSNDNLAEDRIYRVVSGAYDGCIVLLHCNDITAEVLPTILDELKMQGYEMVTISELFARKGVTPSSTVNFQYKDVNTTE